MATKDTPLPELLEAVKADLKNTKDILEAKFKDNPTFTNDFVMQKLTEAMSAIDQSLRNIIIEAEIEDKKAKGILK